MIYENIKKIIQDMKISFDEIEHEESKSCDDSKIFRNKAGLEGAGSKNIVFHCRGNFYLVTTIGDKDIKARNFKHEFGSKDIRFASADEISQNLGNDAKIGSIPPFGFENISIPIFVDTDIFEHEYFMFTPAIPTKTIRVKTTDLMKIYKNTQNNVKLFKVSEEEFSVKEI
ncbi:MAG: YbaK/EbsC family protein [Candidatus Gracilibacteria bacterium]|nr:YbaK/EbsC family protein [Candidatus Gracilibacteria bacterium]